jgi:hypothetical protein
MLNTYGHQYSAEISPMSDIEQVRIEEKLYTLP